MATTSVAPVASKASQIAQAKSGVNSYGQKIGGAVTAGGQQLDSKGNVTAQANVADTPKNTYSVITSKPATTDFANMQADYNNNILPAQQAQSQKATPQLPTIAGHDVSATPTKAQGETEVTNPDGSKYYITPKQTGASIDDIKNFLTTNYGNDLAQTSQVNTGGVSTPQTPAQQQAQTQTGTDINQESTNYNKQLNAVTDEMSQAYNDYKKAISSTTLNSAQQTIVDQTNAAFQQMMTNSQLKSAALSSQTGGVSNMINATMGEMMQIGSQQALTVAKLQQGFQEQNYKQATDAYSQYKDLEQKKLDVLTKTHEDVVSTYKDALAQVQKVNEGINTVALEAAKKGATPQQLDAIRNSKSEGDAITAAGSTLSNGNWDIQKTTDAFGNESIVAINKNNPLQRSVISGQGIPPGGANILSTPGAAQGDKVNPQTGLSFAQYGLLTNTDFKPDNMVDGLAQKYIDQYIKNGTVPTASSLGRNMKPGAMAQVDARARDLYFKATGTSLPNPQIIKQYQGIVGDNAKLANNLKMQEETVRANVDMSLDNITKNNLNSSGFKPLDSLINTVADMFNDPNVGKMLAQNQTIQNELGSLLAVKNASGTTVHDKLASAGIISSSDNEEQIKSKVNALLGEAVNFADSIGNANADMYKQIDPLLQDSNNPLRASAMRTSEQKITDYYTNNPDKRDSIDKAIATYKSKYGTDISNDDLLQAFPEASMSIPSIKK